MDASLAAHIVTASTDDLDSVASADWIVEAVAERLEVKHTLYERLESVVRADAVISSNTSTIALRRLVQGRSADFRSRFLITHFFNPPRRMRLLEIVAGAEVAPDVVRCFSEFAQRGLGKCVVQAHDTPGFIANRIGVYWMSVGLHEAIRMGIAPELADACLAHPFGIPSTGVFGLFDLVGLDVMHAILLSLADALPSQDALQRYGALPATVQSLIRSGLTGRKAGAGFYRLAADRTREVIDLHTGSYRPAVCDAGARAALDSLTARGLLEREDECGRYARTVVESTLLYAASLVPELADSPLDVDIAMREGFGWRRGPFELIDELGPGWFADRLARAGAAIPPLLSEAATYGAFPWYLGGGAHMRVARSGAARSQAFARAQEPRGSKAERAAGRSGCRREPVGSRSGCGTH